MFRSLKNYGNAYRKISNFSFTHTRSNNSYGSDNIHSKIDDVALNKYINKISEEYKHSVGRSASNRKLQKAEPILEILNERNLLLENISNLKELLSDDDKDIKNLALDEKCKYEEHLREISSRLLHALIPRKAEDSCNSIVLEVNAGVGGQEAMLFAKELFQTYQNFAVFKGWDVQIAELSNADGGGIRHACALIDGNSVMQFFKYEAGVHRVQRIPATEKSGRIHTSTVSVLALPQPLDIEVNINPADLKIETKRSTGAGGQHVNTTDSAVRIVHLPTGTSVECQVDRSQIKNRKIALAKLRALLYQQQLDAQINANEKTRKSQVRTNFRNEKIRTYNFSQDRITDHRLPGGNVHNIKVFLEGNSQLENLIYKLDEQYKIESLMKIIQE